ncbi:MAG: hypothetical protein WBC63_08295 [Candidatus Bipolaricaulia bacterium]
MPVVRVFVFVLVGLVLGFVPAMGEESADSYELVAEIRMSELGDWDDARTIFRSATTKDGFVYVASRGDVLHVFDCRELGEEHDVTLFDEPIRQIDLDPGNHNGLLRRGDLLYVYGWSGGQVFDVQDASTPIAVGTFGRRSEEVFHVASHGSFLITSGYEKLVVYSLDVHPAYPAVVAEITMEGGSYAYASVVVGERLCVSGFRVRSSGAISYWLGVWEFADPARPSLIRITETANSGYHLAARDGLLLQICGGQADLWQVDELEPVLLDSTAVCGRAMAEDGEVVILLGGSLAVEDGGIKRSCEFDSLDDRSYECFPHLGAADDDLIVLPRSRSVLVLRREDSQ